MLLLISGIVIAKFFEGQVKNLFIQKVERYFKTPLVIDQNKIYFSLFQDFPSASLTFGDIQLRESLPRSKRNLMEAEELTFMFSFWDAFNESYTIEKVALRNGKLDLRTLHGGKYNYDVMADSEAPKSKKPPPDENFNLSLKQMLLENITVNYQDEITDQEATFKIKNGAFSGDFGTSKYTLNLKSDIFSEQFYVHDVDYLPKKNAKLNLQMGIDFDENSFSFNKSSLQLEDNKFELTGSIKQATTYTDLDLDVNGVDLKIDEMLALLPPSYTESLEGLDSKGILQFTALIKGRMSETKQPDVRVKFDLNNGSISHDNLDADFKKVRLKGNFTNGSRQDLATSELHLKECNFNLAGEPFDVFCKVIDFNEPDINLKLNGKIPLKIFSELAAESGITRLGGSMEFSGITAQGPLAEFANASSYVSYPNFKGTVFIKDVDFKYNGKWVEDVVCTLKAEGRDAQIARMSAKMGKSDMLIRGQLQQLIPMIFQMANVDSTAKKQPLKMDLSLMSDVLDVKDLLAYMPETTAEETTQKRNNKEEDFKLSTNDYAVGKLEVNINNIKRDKLNIKDVKGKLTFNDRNFIIQQLRMKLLGGSLEMRGDFNITPQKNLVVKTFLLCDKVNMSSLLRDLDNFGQETLTNQNLRGKFSSKMFMKAYFNNRLELDERKLRIIADLALDNGEIINFEPMLALSKFIKISDLNKVKFARLENQIEISNRKIRIPAMYINSNVAKFTISGEHTFDNRIYYYVKLNLLNILTNKFRNKNKGLNPNKNPKGGINLFVTMNGPADNPSIKYMKKKTVKDKFERDLGRDKIDLDDVLNKEFSVLRGTTPDFFTLD